MGNSLLDIIVFGRSAGRNAAAKAKSVTFGSLSLAHLQAFEQARAEAHAETDVTSPKLLPDYTRHR